MDVLSIVLLVVLIAVVIAAAKLAVKVKEDKKSIDFLNITIDEGKAKRLVVDGDLKKAEEILKGTRKELCFKTNELVHAESARELQIKKTDEARLDLADTKSKLAASDAANRDLDQHVKDFKKALIATEEDLSTATNGLIEGVSSINRLEAEVDASKETIGEMLTARTNQEKEICLMTDEINSLKKSIEDGYGFKTDVTVEKVDMPFNTADRILLTKALEELITNSKTSGEVVEASNLLEKLIPVFLKANEIDAKEEISKAKNKKASAAKPALTKKPSETKKNKKTKNKAAKH